LEGVIDNLFWLTQVKSTTIRFSSRKPIQNPVRRAVRSLT
jgi:hypothetical protein